MPGLGLPALLLLPTRCNADKNAGPPAPDALPNDAPPSAPRWLKLRGVVGKLERGEPWPELPPRDCRDSVFSGRP